MSEDYVLEDDAPYSPEDEEDANAPYSPGDAADDDNKAPAGPPSPGCSAELQRKVDKLKWMIHDIEQKKQEIDTLADPSQVCGRFYFIINCRDGLIPILNT